MLIKYYTEIELAGIIIRDPVTALTNIAVVLTSIWCFLRFRKHDMGEVKRTWRWFFLFLGVSAFVAIIVHGFSYYMSNATYVAMWTTMCILQGLGITFAQFATVIHYFPERTRKFWMLVPIIQYLTFCTILIVFDSYEVAKIHIAAGLIPIMIWNTILYFTSDRSGGFVALGIFVAAITAFIHTFKITLGTWFNHNDISHVLLCIAIWFICKGVIRSSGKPVLAAKA